MPTPYIFFLIGFMSSGKTTFGQKVAQKLNATFWDLDVYLAELEGRSIASIFETDGEQVFREIEQKTLIQLIDFLSQTTDVHIVACGGGTPCYFDNLHLLKQAGKVIYLQQDYPILLGRLRQLKSTRPMLANLSNEEMTDYVNHLLQTREPYYLQADCIVNAPSPQRLQAAIEGYLV